MPEEKDRPRNCKTVMLLSEEDSKKYAGQYVCVASLDSKSVIAADRDPKLAYLAAQKKGYLYPEPLYVPGPGEVFVIKNGTEIRKQLKRGRNMFAASIHLQNPITEGDLFQVLRNKDCFSEL